jgi:hypothetical protein
VQIRIHSGASLIDSEVNLAITKTLERLTEPFESNLARPPHSFHIDLDG